MAVQVSYPGVYIEEFAPGAPIQGVGTSTAAFIGIAARGLLKDPVKITSWDTFRTLYGEQPVPGFYLWFAVRGFFENGGQVCYIVRASNGAYGSLTIKTRTGAKNLFIVSAREPGALAIKVAVDDQHLLDKAKTSVYRPTGKLTKAASAAAKQIVMSAADAALFYVEYWGAKRLGMQLPKNCAAHFDRMMARPAVQRALQQEGLN